MLGLDLGGEHRRLAEVKAYKALQELWCHSRAHFVDYDDNVSWLNSSF
jgi:hypothetical protein